jgi:hypothetical protein
MERPIAQMNITWAGQQGTASTDVFYDESREDLLRMATEMIRSGDIPGIDRDPDANLQDFEVQRFGEKDGLPNRVVIRPKTPFGGA